ncbi:hypothetical protein PMAYCL1PPCAC_18388, partial [Pristionchus mayeri]
MRFLVLFCCLPRSFESELISSPDCYRFPFHTWEIRDNERRNIRRRLLKISCPVFTKILFCCFLDEVGALVFDFGSHTVRAGYAGDEYPKLDIPSVVGVQENADLKDENGETIGKGRKTFIGTTKVTVPREECEMKTFMKDCMVEDWDLFENMLDHIYSHGLGAKSEFHPALFTEPAWNDRAKREKLCEIMFEKYKLPAFHLVKNAVLTAFANGRTHGLIVDSGATHTSAVPVFEGYCITH